MFCHNVFRSVTFLEFSDRINKQEKLHSNVTFEEGPTADNDNDMLLPLYGKLNVMSNKNRLTIYQNITIMSWTTELPPSTNKTILTAPNAFEEES